MRRRFIPTHTDRWSIIALRWQLSAFETYVLLFLLSLTTITAVTLPPDPRPFASTRLTRKTISLWAGDCVPCPARTHARGQCGSLTDHFGPVAG